MKKPSTSKLSNLINSNPYFQILEILLVFIVAGLIIYFFLPLAGENLVRVQAVIWFANVVMLILVWIGLRLRGEGWKDFGLSFKWPTLKNALRIFLLSLVVLVLGLAGFILGSIIMANITGIPEGANFSSYDYLKDNFLGLIITLIGVYIVSSFGEEVIYRAFLINRISSIIKNPKVGKVIAVVISSVFGFAHYSWGPMGIVQTGLMGLAMAICYLWFKKNLWILVLAHAYMDTILMVQMYLASN